MYPNNVCKKISQCMPTKNILPAEHAQLPLQCLNAMLGMSKSLISDGCQTQGPVFSKPRCTPSPCVSYWMLHKYPYILYLRPNLRFDSSMSIIYG